MLNTNNSETQAFSWAAPVRAKHTYRTQFVFKMCLIYCNSYRDRTMKWHFTNNWSRITVCGQPQSQGSSLFASDTWYAIPSDHTKIGPTNSADLCHDHDKWQLLIWYSGIAERITADCGHNGNRNVHIVKAELSFLCGTAVHTCK